MRKFWRTIGAFAAIMGTGLLSLAFGIEPNGAGFAMAAAMWVILTERE